MIIWLVMGMAQESCVLLGGSQPWSPAFQTPPQTPMTLVFWYLAVCSPCSPW